MGDPEFTSHDFPAIRRATIDLLDASSRKHMIHGLIELDVTRTRELLRKLRREKDREVSLSSYVIYCVAKAVDADKSVHAYRDWRNKLFLFDEVDISTPIERDLDGKHEIIPIIIRAANKKTVFEIHNEIEAARSNPTENLGVMPTLKFYLLLRVL
jgi:pyruvate/2-oxoglutarate dehydrogenase complex dihydrolipoamide acyltransferase (E2) component